MCAGAIVILHAQEEHAAQRPRPAHDDMGKAFPSYCARPSRDQRKSAVNRRDSAARRRGHLDEHLPSAGCACAAIMRQFRPRKYLNSGVRFDGARACRLAHSCMIPTSGNRFSGSWSSLAQVLSLRFCMMRWRIGKRRSTCSRFRSGSNLVSGSTATSVARLRRANS